MTFESAEHERERERVGEQQSAAYGRRTELRQRQWLSFCAPFAWQIMFVKHRLQSTRCSAAVAASDAARYRYPPPPSTRTHMHTHMQNVCVIKSKRNPWRITFYFLLHLSHPLSLSCLGDGSHTLLLLPRRKFQAEPYNFLMPFTTLSCQTPPRLPPSPHPPCTALCCIRSTELRLWLQLSAAGWQPFASTQGRHTNVHTYICTYVMHVCACIHNCTW